MDKIKLIGISAKIGSGKDTIAKIIQEKNPEWENKKFAHKLKEIVSILTGISVENLEDPYIKSKPLYPDWTRYVVYNESMERPVTIASTREEAEKMISDNSLSWIEKETLTPRRIMQILGTEGGRQLIHPKIWVNALFREFNKNSKWLITDTRFPDEAKAIKDKGGILLRIERPFHLRHPELYKKYEKSNEESLEEYLSKAYPEKYGEIYHKSETALDVFGKNSWDIVIHNNFTDLEKLRQYVLNLDF